MVTLLMIAGSFISALFGVAMPDSGAGGFPI